jgi:hypothetical protein
MSEAVKPTAVEAASVPSSRASRGYPEPFAARVAGRERRALGDAFGLTNFGVNLTRLPPGGMSALRHTHIPGTRSFTRTTTSEGRSLRTANGFSSTGMAGRTDRNHHRDTEDTEQRCESSQPPLSVSPP